MHSRASDFPIVDHLPLIFGILLLVVPALVLFGWWADLEPLKSVIAGYPRMKPVTAFGFAAFGAAMLIYRRRVFGALSGRVVDFIGLSTILFALLMLGAYLYSIPTFADSFLIPDLYRSRGRAGNRMSPHSALTFLLFGGSLILLQRQGGALRRVGSFLAIVGSFAAYAAILGHLFGAERLYGISKINGMAIHTAVLFVVVGAALLTADGNSMIVKLLRAGSTGGQAARRLMPVVILVPTMIGFLRVIGQKNDLFDTGVGSAMATLIIVVLMSCIVVFYSSAAHESDEKRRAAELELTEKERRYHELFDYSQGLICIHDCEGDLITVNPAVLSLIGCTREEIEGKNISEFLPAEHRPGFASFLRQIVNEGLSDGLLPIVAKSGRRMMWRYNSILVEDHGKEPYVIGHAQDITELMAAQSQLKKLSLTDELTGLYNRRGFLTLAEQQMRLERHTGTARGLNLLFIDMDGLKKINDALGHEAGSDAIRSLAGVVRSVVRGGDIVARWGGDEFVLLTVGAGDENVDFMIERIERSLEHFNETGGKPFKIACSIGKAEVDLSRERSFGDIIAEADEAMYDQKRLRKVGREQEPMIGKIQAGPEPLALR